MAKTLRSTFLLLAALGAVLAAPARANIGEAYGFGSHTAALAGAGVAWGFEGYSAYSNPAALPLTGSKRLTVSLGVLNMDHRFKPITNVVVENNYTSDKDPVRRDSVDTEYRNTFGQAFGASYVIAPDFGRLTVGVVAFLPLEATTYMDTGEAFIPEYVLYRSRTQRPQVELAFGAEPVHGLFFGVGLHFGFTLTTNATVFLQASANKPSTMRFASSLKPKVGPYLGLLWAPGYSYDSPTSEESAKDVPFTVGVVARAPVNSTNDATLKSGARAFGGIAALDFNFRAISSLFYDPFTMEFGATVKYTTHTRLILQADFQNWRRFNAPALNIQNPTVDSCATTLCGITITPGNNPAFETRDIWIPRFAHELYFWDLTLRTGYAYRPSFLKSLPTEAGNYLDPPRHEITLGLGMQFKKFLTFETPFNLDFHFAWHQLVSQTITKSAGDERGQGAGDLKIGAPGFAAGGKILGGGASLTLAF